MAGQGRILAYSSLVAVAAAAALVLPGWLISLATIAFANGLVVLGLIVLWRGGLVSFGQGLYFFIGAHSVALFWRWARPTHAPLLGFFGGAAGPLDRPDRRAAAGFDRRRGGRADRVRGRLPAGALPRDFLRDAQPGFVHDPVRAARQNRVAWLDRRLRGDRADLLWLCAASARAFARTLLARACRLLGRGSPGRRLLPLGGWRAGHSVARQ